jgi:tRNA A-37 threonylcarbamoyl transferase component Bud32
MSGGPYERTEVFAPDDDPSLATLPVNDLADLLLYALAGGKATAVTLAPEPTATAIGCELGEVALELGRLDSATGDAVVARLALIGGLDLASEEEQLGRLRVATGAAGPIELLLLVRPTSAGLAAELRPIRRAARASAAPEPPVTLPRGFEFGNYRVGGLINSGSQGTVYYAHHVVLDKRVAVKVLHRALASDPVLSARFVIEARAACRARHPAIVDVTDFGTLPDGRPYYVMELVEAGTLAALLGRHGALETRRALSIARQVVDALRAAAEQGVVHRDVKPGNIFVDQHDRARIGDFGLAVIRSAGAGGAADPARGIAGTALYMAPELVDGHHADVRSDLYSVGCVLFEMLTGQVPFDGATAWEIFRKHASAPVPALVGPGGPVPARVERLVRRAMARRVEERYQRADEMLADLDDALQCVTREGWRRWLPG